MVEVDGDEGGQVDQHHAGWTATADLLGRQVDLVIIFIKYFSSLQFCILKFYNFMTDTFPYFLFAVL